MPGPYSGLLHPKRKAELIEIAGEIGVPIPIGGVKFDLEDAIRDALRASRALREDPVYRGLWEAMRESRRPESLSNLGSDNDNSDSSGNDELPVPHPSARTPRRPLASAPSTATLSTTALVPRTPGRLTRSTSQQVGLYARKSSNNLAAAAVRAKDETIKVVGEAQEMASNAWTITTALVGTEIAYLAWAAVPWKETTFGPHQWLLRSPSPSFNIPFPDLSVLLHPTFTRAFLSWSLLTLSLPLVISLLLAFPRGSTRRHGTISPPNALSFSVARLSIVVLSGYIFAKGVSKTHWSFEAVEGYPAVQVLGSAAAVAFAAYEGKP